MEDPELTRRLSELEHQAKQERNRDRALRLSWILLGSGTLGAALCLYGLHRAFLAQGAAPAGPEKDKLTLAVWALLLGACVCGVAVLFFAGRLSRLLLGLSGRRREP